ncbi:MAG: hypothetical protein ACYC3L_05150 [Gemmatimonadaceae bacterium]
MKIVSPLLAAAVLAAASQSAAAQGGRHPLVGQWNIEYTEGQRLASSTHAVRTQAVLTIAQRGSALEATLEFPDARTGLTPAAQRLHGVVVGDSVLLAYTQPARVGGARGSAIRATDVRWQIGASGNRLSGTLLRVIPKSSEMLAPTVITGKRAGG